MLSHAEIQLSMIRVKTERAKQHIFEVEKAASRIIGRGISLVMDSKGKVVGPKPSRTVPIEVVAGAGDAIHNLRCALDHLAWQLARWDSNSPGSAVAFPIAKSFEEYQSIKARKIEGMSPEAKKAIDDLRPYKGGNELLWTIHRLDIIDKHHQMLVFGYKNVFSGMSLPGLFGAVTDQPAHFLGIFADDFEGEYWSLGQPAVRDLEITQMKPLIPMLHELLDFTENLIHNFKPLLGTRRT